MGSPKPLTPTKAPDDGTKAEKLLHIAIGDFAYDPLGYVKFAFPWGKGRLAGETGPDKWQADILHAMAMALRKGMKPGEAMGTAIKVAVASGHGIGKTALVSWIILWFVSCFEFSQTVVTANTKAQLLTKTWRELAKWHRLAINHSWFEWTATQFKSRKYPDTWFASAIPWSEHASEAFAGTHEKYVLMIFDEASLIADKIWEVAEGAMTTPNAIWIAFGNPTRNTGKFAECFGRQKHRWITRQIDSRTAKMANKAQIQQWVEDYGEDSDFVRVRVRGVFPRAGSLQFIIMEEVTNAMKRTPFGFEQAARVMGVDVARHGDDQTCITKRQGLKCWPQKRMRIPDTMQIASRVAEEIVDFDPDAVFIDVTGMGWGVYDRLRQLGYGDILFAVQVGEAAIEDKRFFNKRAELWWKVREWLRHGGSLVDDRELESDLIGPEYGYDPRERVQMEKKEDTKERGLASPDGADSLALTFAVTVEPKKRKQETYRDRMRARLRAQTSGGETPQSAREHDHDRTLIERAGSAFARRDDGGHSRIGAALARYPAPVRVGGEPGVRLVLQRQGVSDRARARLRQRGRPASVTRRVPCRLSRSGEHHGTSSRQQVQEDRQASPRVARASRAREGPAGRRRPHRGPPDAHAQGLAMVLARGREERAQARLVG